MMYTILNYNNNFYEYNLNQIFQFITIVFKSACFACSPTVPVVGGGLILNNVLIYFFISVTIQQLYFLHVNSIIG